MSNITSFDKPIQAVGEGQFLTYDYFTSSRVKPTHHNQIGITSLNATAGITTDGLTTSAGATRRIEVIGVGGGINVKGRVKTTYTQEDTTAVATCTMIKLNTTNAVWEQASQWRLVLDVTSGDYTGKFTIFMPPFSMMEYSTLEFYITSDGACYKRKTTTGFDVSLAGSIYETENMTANATAGSSVAISVADTSGFYEGNNVLISDSVSSENARITAITTNTSITVETLINSYTTANGAKLEVIDYTRTPPVKAVQRGLFKTFVFEAGKNQGVTFSMGISNSVNPLEDLELWLSYLPTEDNAGGSPSKWRLQYIFGGYGADIPESEQYGTIVETILTPPATKIIYGHKLATITPAEHGGATSFACQIVRLGNDSGDTFTGDFKFLATSVDTIHNKLGNEV